MPLRKRQPLPAQKHELEAFAEKYDTLALLYGDPVEVVFKVMSDAVKLGDDAMARIAAVDLMGFRYPKVKAQEVLGDPTKAPITQINVTLQAAPVLTMPYQQQPALAAVRTDIEDLIGGR